MSDADQPVTTPQPPATIQDLMIASGLGRDKVKALILLGQLPGRKIGNRYVIPKGEFDRWYRGEWEPKPLEPIAPSDFIKRRSQD